MKKLLIATIILSMMANFAFSQACSPSTVISIPFTKDGAGQFCWESTCIGSSINSWNLTQLTINGVDFTNKWADATAMPAPIDGKYYIVYNSLYTWGHFEVTGGGCTAITPTPEAITAPPTPEPTPTLIPEPQGDLGKVWLSPAILSVAQTQDAVLEIHANTGTKSLGAYAFTITYPAATLAYKGATEIASGINLQVNSNTAGELILAGFHPTGVPGSTDLSLIRITFGTPVVGAARLDLTVSNLNDVDTLVIGTPAGTGAQVGIEGPVTIPPTPEPTIVPQTPVISSIDPTTGTIGTSVTINGNGFAATANTITFRNAITDMIYEARITASSSDGKTLKFAVPSSVNPECYYGNLPCAAPSLQVTDGPYFVSVTAGSVESNMAQFTVTGAPTPPVGDTPVPPTPDPATPTPVSTPTSTPRPTATALSTPTPIPTPTPVTTPGPGVEPPINVYAIVNTCTSPLSVSVSWTASPSSDISSYKVYRSCATGVSYSLIGTKAATGTSTSYSYPDPAPAAGCYYFVVTAVNNAGVESANSTEGRIAISACPPPTPVITPVQPTPEFTTPEPVTPPPGECITCILPTLAPGTDPNATLAPLPAQSPPPTIPPIAGAVIMKSTGNVFKMCSDFNINVYVNTGTQLLAGYGFFLNYPSTIIGINTCTGTDGVTAGADGFVTAVNASTPGTLKITGLDPSGKGPGTNLAVCSISCKALAYEGGSYYSGPGYYSTAHVTLTVDSLVDIDTNKIGTPQSVPIDFVFYSGDVPPPSPY